MTLGHSSLKTLLRNTRLKWVAAPNLSRFVFHGPLGGNQGFPSSQLNMKSAQNFKSKQSDPKSDLPLELSEQDRNSRRGWQTLWQERYCGVGCLLRQEIEHLQLVPYAAPLSALWIPKSSGNCPKALKIPPKLKLIRSRFYYCQPTVLSHRLSNGDSAKLILKT